MTKIPLIFDRPVTLVGGGAIDRAALDEARAHAPFLVAADRAADRLATWGLMPEAVIGDMDSIRDLAAWKAGPARILHLTEQDTTDFEKCLYATEAPGYLAVGFTGRRMDHSLAVCHALMRYPTKRVVLLGEVEAIAAVPAGAVLSLAVEVGARISLFPMGEATGIHSRGLTWPVKGLTLAPGRQIGTSNIADEPRVELGFDRGGVLVMLARRYLPSLLDALGEG